jgi:hypothetical protein
LIPTLEEEELRSRGESISACNFQGGDGGLFLEDASCFTDFIVSSEWFMCATSLEDPASFALVDKLGGRARQGLIN